MFRTEGPFPRDTAGRIRSAHQCRKLPARAAVLATGAKPPPRAMQGRRAPQSDGDARRPSERCDAAQLHQTRRWRFQIAAVRFRQAPGYRAPKDPATAKPGRADRPVPRFPAHGEADSDRGVPSTVLTNRLLSPACPQPIRRQPGRAQVAVPKNLPTSLAQPPPVRDRGALQTGGSCRPSHAMPQAIA